MKSYIAAATLTLLVAALVPVTATAQEFDIDDSAIDWHSDHVDLRADAIRLRLGDTTLTTAGSDVGVREWVRAGDRVETRVRWFEAGASHDLYLGFGPTHGIWSMSDIRYLQRAPGIRGAGTPSSPFEFAVADAGVTSPAGASDERTLRVGATVPVYTCDGAADQAADVVLELDILRLDVTPPEWTILDDLRVLLGRGRRPSGDWLGHDGYAGPPVAVACTPSVAASLEDEPIALTRPSEPSALTGLVTEEVEPGVLRVLSDGIRDLRSEPLVSCWWLAQRREDGFRDALPTRRDHDDTTPGKVVAGLDGGIWLFWHDRFVRLGDETTYRWADGQSRSSEDDIEVAPDGTIWHAPSSGSGRVRLDDQREWASEYLDRLRRDPEAFAERPECLTDTTWLSRGDGALRAYRDGEWEIALDVPSGSVRQVEVGPDDSIWVAWHERTPSQGIGPLAARLGADGWQLLGVDSDKAGAPPALGVGQDGTVVFQTSRGKPSALWRLTGDGDPSLGDWRPLDVGRNFDDMVMSPDGVIWGRSRPNTIARLDGDASHEWDLAQNTDPTAPTFLGGGGPLAAGHDGSVWIKARQSEAARWCHGIYRFDGSTWTQFLDGHCIYSIDVAPDGWLWLRAGRDLVGQGEGSVDLYAIGPDAPAAQHTEA